jgi:uncharacterized protein with HEPN domain
MSGMRSQDETEAISHVSERLRSRFPHVDPTEINEIVDRYHHSYDGRPIREFIPVLVERQALDQLQHIPQQRRPVGAGHRT